MIDPSRAGGVSAIVRKRLRATLFHELHHLARGWTLQGASRLTGIMDAAIAEGLATAFAREYAGDRAPWGEAPENIEQWVAELRELPPSALRRYTDWMIQHPDGRRWIGYRAGTHIVDLALDRSRRSLISLTNMSSSDILNLAYPN